MTACATSIDLIEASPGKLENTKFWKLVGVGLNQNQPACEAGGDYELDSERQREREKQTNRDGEDLTGF